MAEDAGHDATFRRVEEEAEEDQGEEERPYRREEEEVDLVADGGAQEVMAGVVSAREPRRDGGLPPHPFRSTFRLLGAMAGKVLTSMMLNMMRERKTTVRGAGIKFGRQRSSMERL